MKRAVVLLFIGVFSAAVYSQRLLSPTVGGSRVPDADLIKIVKAEDARRFDGVLAGYLKSSNPAVRSRAALAAGRIGDDAAVEPLSDLMIPPDNGDEDMDVRAMAAFAVGEIESIKAAPTLILVLSHRFSTKFIARAIEAAGKVVAANPKAEEAKELNELILSIVARQAGGPPDNRDRSLVLIGLTAILRAKPEGAAQFVVNFLDDKDPRIRADAANTLARLKDKSASQELRSMVRDDVDPVARASAARALGASDDKDALEWLRLAIHDDDQRVRVSAIRSLGALKDTESGELLVDSGKDLLDSYKQSKMAHPTESAELMEIADALGRILAGTKDERATQFLFDLAAADNGFSPNAIIARMKISPGSFADKARFLNNWHQYSTIAQAMGSFADSEGGTPQGIKAKAEAPNTLRGIVQAYNQPVPKAEAFKLLAAPDYLQAFAAYKTADLSAVMRESLQNKDVFIRATAAGILADQPASPENIQALIVAFGKARINDLHDDDAMLAILDALFKIDKRASAPVLINALGAVDYLVRKKALTLLADEELQKLPAVAEATRSARTKPTGQVLPYDPKLLTKLGQVLNKDADYARALSRKNGSVKAILTTTKGAFTIVFNPEDAPLTVDNWVKLARTGYFNGLEVHRVVPNFVMQDGDPRGDGNGGPGWSIRCEINTLPYDRGAVGMALSGKDTGGSQWFVTHSPQPHLDGGYTVFGHVSEKDMAVVDKIVRGDKILRVAIVGR
jgi:cyclophilin family peptidyl-prolyl cis-trans isomerase/HEAT repeat protein